MNLHEYQAKQLFNRYGIATPHGEVADDAETAMQVVKRLGGQRWKQLHKITYLVAGLSCLHFLMLVKADLTEPLIYILILALLLGVRIYRHYLKPMVLARS